MGPVAWVRRHAVGILLSLLVVSGGLLLVAVGIGALFLLPFSEEVPIGVGAPLFDLLGGIFVPLLLAFVLLVTLTLVLAVSTAWVLVRRLDPGPRVHYWLGRLERSSDLLAQVHLSTLLFGPDAGSPGNGTPEDRRDRAIADLKQRYVVGELTDSEFEQGLEQVFEHEENHRNDEHSHQEPHLSYERSS